MSLLSGYSPGFEAWFKEMQRWEGGRVNDPFDRGGATNRGVTWKTYQALAKKLGQPGTWGHFWERFTEADAKAFAFDFAKSARAEDFDSGAVGYMVADMLWGGGGFQIKYAQRAISDASGIQLKIDGVVGPATVAAANSVRDQHRLFDAITQYRRQAMADIIQGDRNQRRFERGWENRIVGVYRALLPHVGKKKVRGPFMPSAGWHSSDSASEPFTFPSPTHSQRGNRMYPDPYDGYDDHWDYEPVPEPRRRGIRGAIDQSFQDKSGRYSGREITAFVAVFALLGFGVVSIWVPVVEVIFYVLSGLAGTALVGYSIEGRRPPRF